LNAAELKVSIFTSLPRGLRVAVAAPDIAPRKADKDMALADPWALALDRTEDLVNAGVFHAGNDTEQYRELQVLPRRINA
jgi:hypothetical protein